jgi:hypothetical protein
MGVDREEYNQTNVSPPLRNIAETLVPKQSETARNIAETSVKQPETKKGPSSETSETSP